MRLEDRAVELDDARPRRPATLSISCIVGVDEGLHAGGPALRLEQQLAFAVGREVTQNALRRLEISSQRLCKCSAESEYVEPDVWPLRHNVAQFSHDGARQMAKVRRKWYDILPTRTLSPLSAARIPSSAPRRYDSAGEVPPVCQSTHIWTKYQTPRPKSSTTAG